MKKILKKQIIDAFPQLGQLMNCYQQKKGLQSNYDISINCTQKSARLFLKSNQYISPNNHLLLIPTIECFASNTYQGANSTEANNIQTQISSLRNKIQLTSEYLQSLRISLQIYANSRVKNTPSTLNNFAQWMINSHKPHTITDQDIERLSSVYIKSIVMSQKAQSQRIYQYLYDGFMRGLSLSEFKNVMQIGRKKMRKLGDKGVVGPMIELIDHSFQPNCSLEGLYLSHRRESLISLKSLRQIKQGEKITIQYGKYNNIELFFKYGFIIEANPYAQYFLIIKWENYPSVLLDNVQWKHNQLRILNEKMRNVIRIRKDGTINPQDINMLRVLFSKKQAQFLNPIQSGLDKVIYQNITNQLLKIPSSKYTKINKPHPNTQLALLQSQQTEILKSFIHHNSN